MEMLDPALERRLQELELLVQRQAREIRALEKLENLLDRNQELETENRCLKEKVEELRKVLDSQDVHALRKAIDALNAEAQKVGIEIYQRGQGQAAPPPPPSGGEEGSSSSGADKVVDADFEDVDKDADK